MAILSNPKTNHQYYEASAGTTASTFTMTSAISKISFIANDDDTNNLYISFGDTTVTAAASNGQNGIICLLPNEVINDIEKRCTKVNFIRSAGSGNVRFLGV